MICAWDQLLNILPGWIADDVDKYEKHDLLELRLRLGQVPELVLKERPLWLEKSVSKSDLGFVINTASRYSPWSASTISSGYITAPGGHRIGICGDAVVKQGTMEGIRQVSSLCIRVARDYPGLCGAAGSLEGNILIIGPPGYGKTTLLRDLIRQVAATEPAGVVDERGELFPEGMARGKRMDVLTGCNKAEGLDVLIRTMSPRVIAVDEITSEKDCEALIRAGWCGVRLLATAHAASQKDLQTRPLYKSLLQSGLFDHLIILKRDKTWYEEKIAG